VAGASKNLTDRIKEVYANMTNGLSSIMSPLFISEKPTKLLLSEDEVGYDKVPTIDYELANKAYVDNHLAKHIIPEVADSNNDLTIKTVGTGDLDIVADKVKIKGDSGDFFVNISGDLNSFWMGDNTSDDLFGFSAPSTGTMFAFGKESITGSALFKVYDVADSSNFFSIKNTSGISYLRSNSIMEFATDSGGSNVFRFNCGNGETIQVFSNNTSNRFDVDVNANGETTLSTIDSDGAEGHLTVDADGDITLDAASGNIYVKDNGGNYTPGSDYEIATKKYVDDNSGGGGGGAIDISGTPSTNQYARWTDADTLEGRSTSDVLSDIGAQASGNYITGTGSLSAQDLTDIGNLSGTNTGDQATGISDGNILECNANVADNDFLKIDGTKVEGRTASQVLSDIGVYDIQRVGYNSTTSSASFLPLNGYIIERTSTTSNNEFIAFVAPYNGTLEKIMWRSEIAQSGTFRNLLYESSDGTEVPGAGAGRWDVAVDVADDTTVEFDFTTGAHSGDNVLTKGRIYAISIDPISAPQDVNATVVFKWDVTT